MDTVDNLLRKRPLSSSNSISPTSKRAYLDEWAHSDCTITVAVPFSPMSVTPFTAQFIVDEIAKQQKQSEQGRGGWAGQSTQWWVKPLVTADSVFFELMNVRLLGSPDGSCLQVHPVRTLHVGWRANQQQPSTSEATEADCQPRFFIDAWVLQDKLLPERLIRVLPQGLQAFLQYPLMTNFHERVALLAHNFECGTQPCPGVWGKQEPAACLGNVPIVMGSLEDQKDTVIGNRELRDGLIWYRSVQCRSWCSTRSNSCENCFRLQNILGHRDSRKAAAAEKKKAEKKERRREQRKQRKKKQKLIGLGVSEELSDAIAKVGEELNAMMQDTTLPPERRAKIELLHRELQKEMGTGSKRKQWSRETLQLCSQLQLKSLSAYQMLDMGPSLRTLQRYRNKLGKVESVNEHELTHRLLRGIQTSANPGVAQVGGLLFDEMMVRTASLRLPSLQLTLTCPTGFCLCGVVYRFRMEC